uniref:RNase H type-1 domain-containing protein n=1 Tax=Brassica campestris TaxID=3711 RepID=A0A3P5Z5V6_BRACM|nr:unnamed protein product [Brassica rapa]
MANALAIRIALLHAASCNYTHIWLCSDSQGLGHLISYTLPQIQAYLIQNYPNTKNKKSQRGEN